MIPEPTTLTLKPGLIWTLAIVFLVVIFFAWIMMKKYWVIKDEPPRQV